MLMKVFNKGQVVIPAQIRKDMDLQVGDMLDVSIDAKRSCIELKKTELKSAQLAGSLAAYATAKPFPSRRQMHEAFALGMSNET
ncbi:hypothetical protein SCARR_04964 [Pontiella sulfatireligans]|uniref:SpoVT-AbrB domain-containing protein n=2 Tax=Pontiella sulfatireligans TaxID=2750658 RepID=A0A6C2UUP7_9BACT|nr:hypothetical protein SCARR_04964 [Pontiella sulfatireligans]